MPTEPFVGQTVSHYAFLEKLGAGGRGEIYKARDARLNRMVAVKVLAPGKIRDPTGRRRFIQEAQAASALNHPNIITIYDILPDGDTQYMVMEFVSGKTLQQLLSAGPLPVSQVLQLATQMANALGVAHAAGIIHRDLKPANVMVTGSGLVKVLDFGLAKLTDVSSQLDVTSDGEQNTLTTAPLTREGSIMGTVNYMSPEQAEGLKVDARSDIFSFGAVLYEMVTGRRAFDGDSGISTLSAVLRDEVRPIHEMAPDVPAELAAIVNRCLRKSPAARWQSMTEVEAELSGLKRRSEFPSPATAPVVVAAAALPHQNTSRKSAIPKAILLGAVCLAVLALAVVMAWWSTHQKQPAEMVAAPAPVPAVVAPAPAPVAPSPVVAASPAPAPVVTKVDSKKVAPAIKPAAAAPVSAPVPAPVSAPIVTEPVAPPAPQRAAAAAPAVRTSTPAKLVPVALSDGTPFRIALLEDVPNDSQVGRALRFRVLDDVQSGNTTVIAKGSTVSGTLADLGGKRKFFGERSKVQFRLISAQSVDDIKINVRATPAPRPDGVETRPFATPNRAKDKELIATSGTEYIAYISGDQTVSVHK
ncbi:MAG: serine/threonine-protein kinase [Bryobacteraceae bacterium]